MSGLPTGNYYATQCLTENPESLLYLVSFNSLKLLTSAPAQNEGVWQYVEKEKN